MPHPRTARQILKTESLLPCHAASLSERTAHLARLLLPAAMMLLPVFILAGCAAPVKTQAPAQSRDPLLLQPSTVVGYLIGERHGATDEIVVALNERLTQELNTSIELRYLNWGELDTRYPLVLASGEGVDWIYTASWCYYFTEAQKGAFLELDAEKLARYMPRHMAATPEEAWKDAAIDEKIFMVPTGTPDTKYPAMLIRADLRKKYGLPEIKRLTDIEPYLAALKENEPDLVPMNLDNGYDVTNCRFTLMGEDGFLPGALCDGITYNTEDPDHLVVAYTDEPALSTFRRAAILMKDWYDKGYTNRNPFSNTTRSKESFQMGQSGIGFGNLYDIETNVLAATQRGFEVEVVPLLSDTGHYPRDPYTVNGVAVSASSRQPERTLMVLDMLMEDPACNLLASFGIEGQHYALDAEGTMKLLTPSEEDTAVFTHTGFWFTNKTQWPPMADWPAQYADLRANAADFLYDSPLSSFAYATVGSNEAVTRVGEVFRKYGDPLAVGAVADVDETLRVMSNLLKIAGVEDLKADAQQQIARHLDARGE